jgi:hypothetical protein
MARSGVGGGAQTHVKAHCYVCDISTNHVVLHTIDRHGVNDSKREYWTTHQIIECTGCESPEFRSVYIDSNIIDPKTGKPLEEVEVYPYYKPSDDGSRKAVSGAEALPKRLRSIYHETLRALNGEMMVLCGAGVRAVVEAVARDRKARGKDLVEKIDNLVAIGDLTREGAAVLHKLRTLGNRAVHEVKAHSEPELMLAMDVVDHLLKGVYILPAMAKKRFK